MINDRWWKRLDTLLREAWADPLTIESNGVTVKITSQNDVEIDGCFRSLRINSKLVRFKEARLEFK